MKTFILLLCLGQLAAGWVTQLYATRFCLNFTHFTLRVLEWFFDKSSEEDCDDGGARIIKINFPSRRSPVGTASFGSCSTT